VRNINVDYSALSELHGYRWRLTRGDAPHVVRRLPLAVIFRAFGAQIQLCAKPRNPKRLVASELSLESHPDVAWVICDLLKSLSVLAPVFSTRTRESVERAAGSGH